MSILQVVDLNICTKNQQKQLVKNVCFSLHAKQCVAIIGESGSGKTLTARALMGLTPPNLKVSGKVCLNGQNLLTIAPHNQLWVQIRGQKMAMVMQNGSNAFNPLFTLKNQVQETIRQHLTLNTSQVNTLLKDTFNAVALPDYERLLCKFPHELSGGTLQRIMIALTFMLKPQVVIADEPISSIDWISRKEVINLFMHGLKEHDQALLMITHDFGEVRSLADYVLVMQHGVVIEHGLVNEVLENPQHEYTQELIQARRSLDRNFMRIRSKKSPCIKEVLC